MKHSNITTSDILKLFDSLSHAIEAEEKLCEQRITFFLTLGTATIGVVNLLYRKNQLDSEQFFWSMLCVLVSLLIYGLHTLNRLNWRWISIQIWRGQINIALKELSDIPLINNFLGIRRHYDECVKECSFIGKLQGSPAEFMYITNAFIVNGIILTLVLHAQWPVCIIIPLCVIIFIGTVYILWKTFVSIRKRFIPEQTREDNSK